MARGRIKNKGYTPIKNANLIGRGGKHIKPVRGSWVKGYNQAMAKPSVKAKTVVKSPLKSKTGFVPKKSHAISKKVNRTKPSPLKHVTPRMRANLSKSTPKPQMKMQTRKKIRKPPTRGR